ncbi:MAG TPA: DmsE family decaheme c-type cytochrome [Burkholderiales bacterium]|nr:DmsE family decaheme c-type cytochrome [Burkholderiales bacterium]
MSFGGTASFSRHAWRRLLFLALGLLALIAADALLVPPAHAQQPAAQEKDKVLRGDAKCTTCHDESWPYPVLEIGKTKHGVRGDSRTPTCTSCHGESVAHQSNPGADKPDLMFGKHAATPVEQRSEACLSCHRGTARTHWAGSAHQVNLMSCSDCHQSHAATDAVLYKKTQTQVCFACHREQRADSYKISTHPIQVGKVVCSDCHNPHGSPGPTMVKKNTINETCFTCHAEKRGPFLFEHQPVVENCANCHTPHGSNLTPLLVSRAPWLCQSCHDGQHSSENPVGRNAASNQAGLTNQSPSNQALGRACLNCHSVIHGSNSPNGGYFQR